MIVSDERVARFVSEGLGFNLVPPYTVMGIERHGIVVAGVLFNCFEGADVHFTAYGKGWTPSFMRAVGQYVFGILGCERMTAVTEEPAVVRLACKLGGMVEGCLRSHFGRGRDALLIGVLKNEYRYATDNQRAFIGGHHRFDTESA